VDDSGLMAVASPPGGDSQEALDERDRQQIGRSFE
jgi:hypothetical protein